jgi:hypothetical protein
VHPNALPKIALHNVLYSQWAYGCSLVVAAMGALYIPRGSMRTAVILVPVLTALLCIAVTYWLYDASDQYIRTQLLKCVAITAVIVAFCSLAYVFLELLGFPRLSTVWINLRGWSAFNLQVLYVIYRSK